MSQNLVVVGRITKIGEVEKGTSKEGKEWQKLTFLLDNNETYNNVFALEVFGEEKVSNFLKFNKEGQTVKVEFNVKTNEWNGKYFTSLSAWLIRSADQMGDLLVADAKKVVDKILPPEDDNDDLPF